MQEELGIIANSKIIGGDRLTRQITADNLLLVYNNSEELGNQIASYYADVRGVPAANILGITLDWSPATGNILSDADVDTLVDAIAAQHVTKDICATVLCGHFPC